MYLEDRGFRFIELNYLPRLETLQSLSLADENVGISLAMPEDRDMLVAMAGATFRHGRFHQDPRIGAALGEALRHLDVQCIRSPRAARPQMFDRREFVGFFVVEPRETGHIFWSLIGLAPDRQGGGFGKRVWRAMLRFHQNEGMRIVSTSISSLNVPVLNMYVSLGFRFPAPSVTMHWCPTGSLA